MGKGKTRANRIAKAFYPLEVRLDSKGTGLLTERRSADIFSLT